MDHRVPGAISLGRVLLRLERCEASGALTISTDRGEAQVAFNGGRIQGAAPPGLDRWTLGDLLIASGELDPDAHASALAAGAPNEPVGRWLVGHGVTTAPAVAHALRVQLRERIAALFASTRGGYRFRPGGSCIGVEPLPEPLWTSDVVLESLRRMTAEVRPERMRHAVGEGPLRITAIGRLLLERASLWPQEAAVAAGLQRKLPARDALALGGGSPRALRFFWLLHLIQAVAPAAGGSYPLLLRKQRQLRHAVGPRGLLDLSADASPDDARRALRRLAGALHPDRFGDVALRQVSTDVMAALAGAEAQLRG